MEISSNDFLDSIWSNTSKNAKNFSFLGIYWKIPSFFVTPSPPNTGDYISIF